jgi:hypothetical protein
LAVVVHWEVRPNHTERQGLCRGNQKAHAASPGLAGVTKHKFLELELSHQAGKIFSSSADSVSRFDFCQQILSTDFYHQQFWFCQQISLLSADSVIKFLKSAFSLFVKQFCEQIALVSQSRQNTKQDSLLPLDDTF